MKQARKPRPDSLRKRLSILDAAARAIAERGFHGMSMRDLAGETGQALASFYNYFSSKEELLFQIQSSAFRTMIAGLEDALRGLTSPRDRLFAFIYQHARYVAEHPDVMRVLVHEASALPPRERAKVRTLKERYYGLGRDIVAALAGTAGTPQDPRELERLTYGIFGMLNWVYGWYDPARHGSPGEVAHSLHRLVLGGVTSPSAAFLDRESTDIERRLSLCEPLSLFGPEVP
ncbi:MAG: TetR/AcrR family transcriptional regulator [Myxococcales bacterium]